MLLSCRYRSCNSFRWLQHEASGSWTIWAERRLLVIFFSLKRIKYSGQQMKWIPDFLSDPTSPSKCIPSERRSSSESCQPRSKFAVLCKIQSDPDSLKANCSIWPSECPSALSHSLMSSSHDPVSDTESSLPNRPSIPPEKPFSHLCENHLFHFLKKTFFFYITKTSWGRTTVNSTWFIV